MTKAKTTAAKTDTITLGGKTHKIEGFTFDQLGKIVPMFVRMKGEMNGAGLEAASEIIATAIGLRPEDIAGTKTTLSEIVAALAKIAEIAGLADAARALADFNVEA